MSRTVGRLAIAILLLWPPGVAAQSADAAKAAPPAAQNPQKVFAAGEAALREGKLDDAERAFRQVLAAAPGVAGAYANLGVIHMRRKQ